MKICILGGDFSKLEARLMAHYSQAEIDKELDPYAAYDLVIIREQVELTCPVFPLEVKAILPPIPGKPEPHWVTRNAKGKRY